MVNIERHVTTWSGGPGLPGYTNFYFLENPSQEFTPIIDNFFALVQGSMSPGVSVHVANEGEVLDSATGELVSTWTDPTAAVIRTGTGSSTYAAPVGATVAWSTSSINRGRKVRGRTFLVPLSGDAFEGDGTLLAAARTKLENAARDLFAFSNDHMVVWSRPRLGVGGIAAPITGASVRDVAAVLTSRRD